MMNAERSPRRTSLSINKPVAASTTRLTATSPHATNVAAEPKKSGATKTTTAIRAGTGYQRRQQDRQQPRPARIDDPRAHDCRHIAAKAQEQRQEALAVQAHQVHEAVHHVGGAGHVARIFQQSQHGKKDDQDGQEGEHRALRRQ